MSLGRNYDKACPIFNFSTRDGGVLFPVVLTKLCNSAGTLLDYINLDGSLTSTILARFRVPMPMRLITCQAMAVADGQGAKAAAATTEPVIGIGYGTAVIASAALGTDISLITCDGAAPYGTIFTPSAGTTAVDFTVGQEVYAYLKTAAASATSANQDGGAKLVLWFAIANAPA